DALLTAMEAHQRPDIHIAHAISIGDQERVVAQPRLQAFDSTAGERREAGIDELNLPILGSRQRAVDLTRFEVDRKMPAQIVSIKEIALDEVSHVSAGDNEVA